MVNGPQSGGEMPLGKEYWKKLEKSEKIKYSKEIKTLDPAIYKKPMMDHASTIKPKYDHIDIDTVKKLSQRETNKRLDNFANSLPEKDKAAFNNAENKAEFIRQYIKDHPDFKPSLELSEKPAEKTVPAKTDETGPVSAQGEETQTDSVEQKKPVEPENSDE